MRKSLVQLSYNEPTLDLIVPEATMGGTLYQIYKEYQMELYRDEMIVGSRLHSYKLYAKQLKALTERRYNQFQQSVTSENYNNNKVTANGKDVDEKMVITPQQKQPLISTTHNNIPGTHIISHPQQTIRGQNVCILTRSASVHDRSKDIANNNSSNVNIYHHTGIQDYIRCKLRL